MGQSLCVGLLFVSMFVWSQSDSASASKVFNLQDCIDYAFDHQQDIKNAEFDVQKSIAQKDEAIGFGLPQISGKIQTMHNIDLKQQYLPANAFNPLASPDDI